MKKKIKLTILTVLILVLIFIIIWVVIKFRDKKTVFSENYIMTEEIASLLSFTYYKTDKWEEHIRKVAKGTLNYRELLDILELLGVEEYIRYEEEAGFKKVSRSTFFEIYKQILDILDVENKVKAEDKLFVGESAKETGWLTQDGYEQVLGGLQYIRQYDMYRVYTVDDTIIGLEKRVDTPVIWENVFIHTAGEEKMQILFEKELLFIDVPNLKETISDTVCDIEWKDRTVQTIYKKEETIQGTVLSYDDTKIEIAGYGVLEHGGKLKIYKTYGTNSYLSILASAIYGSSETVFYVSAVYLSKCKNKKVTKAILISLFATFLATIICSNVLKLFY